MPSLSSRLLALCILIFCLHYDDSKGQSSPPALTSTLCGELTYEPDPKRPWRFSRYYVASTMKGALAEAVIALEGPSLASSATPQAARSVTLDQSNFQFVPETIAIRAGDSVRVVNSDEALHNVMSQDGAKPFNVNLAKGQQFVQTFAQAGGLAQPIRVGCVFHGAMRAWIYVFDHPWFAVTERDGKFQFNHVPPGTYTLAIIHPAGKLRWSGSVDLKSAQTNSVHIQLSPDNLIGGKPTESQIHE